MKKFLFSFIGLNLFFYSIGGIAFIIYKKQQIIFIDKMIDNLSSSLFVWLIIFLIILGYGIILNMFFNSLSESKLLENIISKNKNIIIQGEIPLQHNQSIIIKHLQKIATANKFKWNEESKQALQKYLKNILFLYPHYLDFLTNALPYLGLLGTVLGMSEALFSKAQGNDMYMGLAFALGTTILGMVGNLFLSSLNKIIKTERQTQLNTLNVLISLRTVREDTNE